MTLYAVTARFKPGIGDQRDALHVAFSDHLRQPLLHIRLVGALCDAAGERTGILMLMEADSRDPLDHFLQMSPYGLAGLYAGIDIDALQIEAGGLI